MAAARALVALGDALVGRGSRGVIERRGEAIALGRRPLVALRGGAAEPDIGLERIARHPVAGAIVLADADLGDDVSKFGGAAVKCRRCGVVLGDAEAIVVETRQRRQRVGVAGGGERLPCLDGACVVARVIGRQAVGELVGASR